MPHIQGPEELKAGIQETMRLLQNIISFGINGIGPIASAESLAKEYLNNHTYASTHEKINALTRWEERKNFTSGFLTSMGGLLSLPVAIPSAMAINLILQARLSGAIAYIAGFDIQEPPVRTAIAVTLLGNRGKEILNTDLTDLYLQLQSGTLNKIPKKSLLMINQLVAHALIRMASKKGFTRLSKAIPLVGGLVGGILDYGSCKETAQFAKELFLSHEKDQEK